MNAQQRNGTMNIESNILTFDQDFLEFKKSFNFLFGCDPHKYMFIDHDTEPFSDELNEKLYYLSVNAWQFWSVGRQYGKDQIMSDLKSQLLISEDEEDQVVFDRIDELKGIEWMYDDLSRD